MRNQSRRTKIKVSFHERGVPEEEERYRVARTSIQKAPLQIQNPVSASKGADRGGRGGVCKDGPPGRSLREGAVEVNGFSGRKGMVKLQEKRERRSRGNPEEKKKTSAAMNEDGLKEPLAESSYLQGGKKKRPKWATPGGRRRGPIEKKRGGGEKKVFYSLKRGAAKGREGENGRVIPEETRGGNGGQNTDRTGFR